MTEIKDYKKEFKDLYLLEAEPVIIDVLENKNERYL